MTHERQPCQNNRLLEPCESVDLCDVGEVPSFYNAIEPEIQPKPCSAQRPDVDKAYKGLRQQTGTELLGSYYAKQYLQYQYRRGCRPNTMRSICTTLRFFCLLSLELASPTLNTS